MNAFLGIAGLSVHKEMKEGKCSWKIEDTLISLRWFEEKLDVEV